MKILVINAGSSSLKYQLYDKQTLEVVGKGICEKIGLDDAFHKHGLGDAEKTDITPMKDHHDAMQTVLDSLLDPKMGCIKTLEDIVAAGHRVVHGGEYFSASVLINDEVIQRIEECVSIAPLHNPPALTGIKACIDLMPNAAQVAVFDTAFHQTMPPKAYMYALPYDMYTDMKIRRYGFHGTSHRYVAQRAAAFLGKPAEELKLITCHLGNGCSLAAVDGGKSVDTSMGLTPLEGVVMGTRCGSIDPAIVTYLIDDKGMTAAEVNTIMNKKSGL
ncbi:MAG: acetate kinase, partial [Coriobacteriales bacterium]|nr:acetate kinase [Coriobacteriales bacterium]